MLNRQIEDVRLRRSAGLPRRKIGLALLAYEEVRDGAIDLNVVQVPLAPNQGNDLESDLEVIDGQQRRLCLGFHSANGHAVEIGRKRRKVQGKILYPDRSVKRFAGSLLSFSEQIKLESLRMQ
jgi:hypothetical protein